MIAHGHPELSPGGAEIAAYQLFQGLREDPEVEACFLAAADPFQPEPHLPLSNFTGRPDEFILNSRRFDPFLFSQLSGDTVARFRAFVARLRPDIVHFHHYTNLGLELFAAVRQAAPRARIFLTLHEYLAICAHFGQMVETGTLALCSSATPRRCAGCFPNIAPEGFAARQDFIRAHFDLVDVFVAPSEFLRGRYIAWGIEPGRIAVIENGTPAAKAPQPRPLGANGRRSVFGFFGQINPYKGLAQLLSAFEAISNVPGDVTHDLQLNVHAAYLDLNPPDFTASIRSLLARTAPQVRFFGPYERDDLGGLMAAVDWVVVPSIWWENAPLVIEEALAHRRPVLCSDIGGMAEKVRPGKDGYHFPVGNVAALTELLMRVASDPGCWDRFQQTMRSPTTVARAVADHLRLYRDVGGALSQQTDRRVAPRRGSVYLSATARLSGSARIVILDRGFYALEISAMPAGPRDDRHANGRSLLHVCALPGTEPAGIGIADQGTTRPDAWLGPEGGTLIVQAKAPRTRLVVTVYCREGPAIALPEIAIREISGAY